MAVAVCAITEVPLALVVFAAELAMRALFALTAAEMIGWALRHERADVVDAIDTRAEIRARRDAIVRVAAFALFDTCAIALCYSCTSIYMVILVYQYSSNFYSSTILSSYL